MWRHGYEAILTDTASPAMLAVNRRFGFARRGPGEIRLVKSLRSATS